MKVKIIFILLINILFIYFVNCCLNNQIKNYKIDNCEINNKNLTNRNNQIYKSETISLNLYTKLNSSNETYYVESPEEKAYLSSLAGKFLEYSTIFDASKNPLASELCKKHTKMLKDGVKNFHLWALKMHDSSGKISSGILNGNINQFGDFDQCLDVAHNEIQLKGQYCLAYLQPYYNRNNSTKFKKVMALIQSHGAFKSDFNDAGHRVPRFSLINWGLCIPSSCSPADVEYSLKEFMINRFNQTGLEFNVRVETDMCQIKNSSTLKLSNKIVMGFFMFIIIITVISTLYDKYSNSNVKNNWLISFSLIKNGNWLFSTTKQLDDIQTVHGIRFLNAIMLLLSHKSMAIFFNPYVNRTFLSESLGRPWTVVGRAASLYTDPFLLFSGMLTSYSIFGKLQNNKNINIKLEYLNRIFRIFPPLAAIIMFCTFILPYFGSGPQWNLVVNHNANLCKKSWWKNLLFIHNYFGFGDMCLTHTHHLGIDTQLFFCAPIMIIALWKWPRKGLFTLLAIASLATACRYYTTIQNELSNYVYFGTTIKRLFKTADFMYSFPPYRSTVYIMGIILGYVLRKYSNLKLTKIQLNFGWSLTFICFVMTIFGPAPMGDIDYTYNSVHAAIYAAFAPVLWCIIFCWIVFVSHLGFRNKLTNLLSWRGFQITTKLSYAIYLTQFPIFFYNVGRRRHIDYYYNFFSTMLDVNEYFCVTFFSILLTLLFDAPFQNMKQILFNKYLRPHDKKET